MSYILVTGSNGFIGKSLTEALLKKGYKVLGLSKSETPKIMHSNYKYISVDLTNTLLVEKIFLEYEISVVIHLAAIAHYKHDKNINWNDFYRVNTLASKTIFECAKKVNASVFYSSTIDVYGNSVDSLITEDTIPVPTSDYAKSKYLAEKYLEELMVKNYIIGRFAPVYGKGFMKDIYKRIYLKYPDLAFIVGKGYDYHFVSINNIIDFTLHWVEKQDKISGIVNICDNELLNSKYFLDLEKRNKDIKYTIFIPSTFIVISLNILDKVNGVLNNNLIKKMHLNLNKLIKPKRYSINKMSTISKPKWNIENTVYKGK